MGSLGKVVGIDSSEHLNFIGFVSGTLDPICAYTGISDLRYELSRSTRVPASALEGSLKRNLAKLILKIVLVESLGKVYADVEISQPPGKLGN
ncbi:hypothetical protein HRbin02_00963 [Candidatus Calditenuaceae archaeon HR02]|nr:hypothetical protein HRbin02_00963 [Candidatus Calditenuaceae archaeon HR02]